MSLPSFVLIAFASVHVWWHAGAGATERRHTADQPRIAACSMSSFPLAISEEYAESEDADDVSSVVSVKAVRCQACIPAPRCPGLSLDAGVSCRPDGASFTGFRIPLRI